MSKKVPNFQANTKSDTNRNGMELIELDLCMLSIVWRQQME